MKKIVRQIVGIDVAKDELVICLGRMTEDLLVDLYARSAFVNTEKGFELLQSWIAKNTDPSAPLRYVLEATGVYHEKLAYYLVAQNCAISIVLPSRISNFFRSLQVKTVTDKTASEAIAQFGCERQLETWQPPTPIFRRLRQLTRERGQLIDERTMIKNQLHAEQAEAYPVATSIARMKKRMILLQKQEQEIKMEIEALLKTDTSVQHTVKKICSLIGIGAVTAVTVLAETNGFDLIRNKKQLTSYAGLDVREKQSGTSVKGQARISKRGNKHLRKAMYMPALSAVRHDERFKALYARLLAKHGIKLKALVAVQRKLLEMIYTIYKTDVDYDKDYLSKKEQTTATTIKN